MTCDPGTKEKSAHGGQTLCIKIKRKQLPVIHLIKIIKIHYRIKICIYYKYVCVYKYSHYMHIHTHTQAFYIIYTHLIIMSRPLFSIRYDVKYPLFFIKAARWLVLFPGAAQASMTWLPARGFRKKAGRQLAYRNIST